MQKLRQYQEDVIRELAVGIKTHQRQVLCLPTGAGKTVVFSEICRRIQERDLFRQVLVLTDRVELFDQTVRSMGVRTLDPQRIVAGATSFDRNARVTVGMVETVKRRISGDYFAGYEPYLIIADEAHKAVFTKVYDAFPSANVIGATATPVGDHFEEYFTKIVAPIDIPDLIATGHLMPCRAFQMQDDMSDLKTRAGEYTDESLFAHFDRQKLYAGVISEWTDKAAGRKTLVFNVNIKHTEEMTRQFNEAGIRSECVTSLTTKEDRSRILAAFAAGEFPVLNNCGILTTGYDEPGIECIVMNRATKSLPLWLQCCGRGSRPAPGKSEFIVLDFGMNHNQHGMWQESRTWSLKRPEKRKRDAGDGLYPVKNCPSCAAMLHASATRCDWCGHEIEARPVKLHAGHMVEITTPLPSGLIGRRLSDLTIHELVQLHKAKHKRFGPPYLWRVIRSRGMDEVRTYAKYMGYSQGWVQRQWHEIREGKDVFTDSTI